MPNRLQNSHVGSFHITDHNVQHVTILTQCLPTIKTILFCQHVTDARAAHFQGLYHLCLTYLWWNGSLTVLIPICKLTLCHGCNELIFLDYLSINKTLSLSLVLTREYVSRIYSCGVINFAIVQSAMSTANHSCRYSVASMVGRLGKNTWRDGCTAKSQKAEATAGCLASNCYWASCCNINLSWSKFVKNKRTTPCRRVAKHLADFDELYT